MARQYNQIKLKGHEAVSEFNVVPNFLWLVGRTKIPWSLPTISRNN